MVLLRRLATLLAVYLAACFFCESVLADEPLLFEKSVKECNKTHFVPNKLFSAKTENVSSLFRETLKDNHHAQCLMKCVLNKLQIVDENGNVVTAGLKNNLLLFQANLTDYLKKNSKFNLTTVNEKQIDQIISKCQTKDDKDEPCLKSYKLLVCFTQENDALLSGKNNTLSSSTNTAGTAPISTSTVKS